MSIFGQAKKWTHKIAHETGRISGQVTGSDRVANIVEKGVKYGAPATGLGTAYQAAHILGHVGSALNPEIPTVETPQIEYPDYSEYFAAMGEYIAAMNEAMNRQEPAQEPLKQAQVEMSAARADTNRKQLLRRGLMSTYTRYGQSGGTQRLGA